MNKMNKIKDLNSLTIKEFELYSELIGDEQSEPDVYGIFELFGLDASGMVYDDFYKKLKEIQSMRLSTKGVKKVYTINGRRFKASLNPIKLSAGQFIDFQSYLSSGAKLQSILSVFLIPQDKSWFLGKYITKKYNTGYDIFEVQTYLYENMRIGDASELSAFFLTWSNKLLKTKIGRASCRERV
jgi:hypothetical protein